MAAIHKRALFFLCLLAISTIAFSQPKTEITRLGQPHLKDPDGKIEVLEFFNYACPHCAYLETEIKPWIKSLPGDVKFVRVPGPRIHGFDCVSLFYTLEAIGELERLHSKIFAAIHKEKLMLTKPEELTKWLLAQGVSLEKFNAAEASPLVLNRVERARILQKQYRVFGVPAIVVDGRASVLFNVDPAEFFSVVDTLIVEARKRTGGPVSANTASVRH